MSPPRQTPPAHRSPVEFPTLVVAFVIYAAFFGLTWLFNWGPLWIVAPLCSVVLAWYGSLQHETIHGHPTPYRRLNALLACVPLSLWIPYARYRQTHLRHHFRQGQHLTEVDHDPESFYLPRGALAQVGPFRRAIYEANRTLCGRVILGPAVAVLTFWAREASAIRSGDRHRLFIWVRHVVGVCAVLAWVVGVCHVPLSLYLALIVYPSMALTQVRSYAEHKAEVASSLRTRVVETNRLWSLIFLNNNLHIAHHAYPHLPWYRLPPAWRRMRESVPDSGLIFAGYAEVMRRYLFRPYITAEHPFAPRSQRMTAAQESYGL
jgi:fatty acid desaturase